MTELENDGAGCVTEVPCNRAAEDAVLGACLINADMVPLVGEIVHTADFHFEKSRWIWEAIQELARKHEYIDVITVAAALGAEKLTELGGNAYLARLIIGVDSYLHAESYARLIADCSLRRRVLRAVNRVATLAYRDEIMPAELLAAADRELRQASVGARDGRIVSLADALGRYYQNLQDRQSAQQLPGISTGFAELDRRLGGGLRRGSLNIVAAFPGGGKTSFLTMVTRHAARAWHVRFHSLEMTVDEILNRLLAQASGLNSQAIDTARLKTEEWQSLAATLEELGDLKLEVDDTGPISVPELRATCLRAQAEGKLDLLVIDYAGLVKSPGEGEYEQQRALSRDFKLLAKELGIPILVAHQLNRKGREADAPKIHHLRGSGTWEQDADVVLLLHPSGEPARGGLVPHRLEIAKQRNGPTGCIDLLFRPETTEFVGREER